MVYSFKRLKDPQIKGPFAWRAGNIKELRAPDPYTVQYELEEPFSELLLQLTMFTNAIHNKDSVEALGKDYGIKGIDGTGPWCFDSWQPRTEIVLKRHDAYKWGPSLYKNKGPVKFEKLIVKIVPEDSSRVAAMLSGQFDITHQFPSQFISQAKAAPMLTVTAAKPNFQLLYFGFKITRPMVSDRRVREAMSIAINRAEIAKAILLGNAEPAFTIVDPDALDHDPATKGIVKEDIERAKALLEEAGWKVGSRRHPRKGRRQAAAEGLLHRQRQFGEVRRGDPGLSAQDRRRLAAQSLGLHHLAGEDGRAGLRGLVGHGAVSVGRRSHEHLFRLRQYPDAEPDELEGRGDRCLAEAGPLGAEPRRPHQILRAGAAEGDARASVDAGAQHQHGPGRQQADQRRAAAHDLPEHVLQGARRNSLTKTKKGRVEARMRGILTGLAALLAAGATAAEAQTLRMMKSLDAPHYDGARTTWSPTSDIVNMFQDTLVAMDWDGKTPIPYLAKSWTLSPDGKLYTFKLRDDVQFCSGKKFTAADVIYSFTRLTDPEFKAPLAWRAGNIKELRAPDPYTVEYELKEPFADLLLQLTMFTTAIHNKDSVESLGKDYGVKGIDGTGPWCFESWQPRTEIVLKRHDAYKWGPSMYENKGPVKFEKLVIKIVPEDSSRGSPPCWAANSTSPTRSRSRSSSRSRARRT